MNSRREITFLDIFSPQIRIGFIKFFEWVIIKSNQYSEASSTSFAVSESVIRQWIKFPRNAPIIASTFLAPTATNTN
jgi:hypothetical protein